MQNASLLSRLVAHHTNLPKSPSACQYSLLLTWEVLGGGMLAEPEAGPGVLCG